jgi:BASS family bile acid:Na+ symporter
VASKPLTAARSGPIDGAKTKIRPFPMRIPSKIMGGLKGYFFTFLILVSFAAGMIWPGPLAASGAFDPQKKWLLQAVIQLVMFGMGAQMTMEDFKGVARRPRGALIGVLAHYSIMPVIGFLLAKAFRFDGEIAAGIVLVGSCSSGLSSNVMTYLAGANLALSVTVTALTTVAAPLLTPFLMRVLAGRMVEVRLADMTVDIVKIVLVPIGAALLHDHLKTASPGARRAWRITAGIAALWFAALAAGGWRGLQVRLTAGELTSVALAGYLLGAVLAGVVYHWAWGRIPGLRAAMPVVSMAGVAYFTVTTTVAGRDHLVAIGLWLLLASVLHNAAGYLFGLWVGRRSGLDLQSARSIAFEVGLQNCGMASGLAASMGKLATVGLAAAVFSPWMNISGSILANYWRGHAGKAAPRPLQ